MFKILNYLTYSAFILAVFAQSAFGLPAFPGAEGFGSDTRGGRGGKVIAVTNLNDSGPGSLREALATSGPRIVVFRVAGTIELRSRLEVTEPFLTVAGQTAPGDGITITKHSSMDKGLMAIRTHDLVLRYLRLRNFPSSEGSGQVDAVTMYPEAYNIVVDHCSFSWGTDEVFQADGAHNMTFQWNIVAEGLSHSTHPEGEHSKGLHFRGENSDNISVHHNLLANHMDRSPNINTTGTFDMVNNVMYNGGKYWTMIKDVFGAPNVNAVGNYYKRGPSSMDKERKKGWELVFYKSSSSLDLNPKLYVKDNIGWHRPTNDLPEEALVEPDSRFMLVNKPFKAPPITTVSASQAFDQVLDNAGATLPVRDAHDQRIVSDVRNGTGRIIDHPAEVGGLLEMASGTLSIDTDGDGMPDKWEEQYRLDPNNGADGNQDRNGDGYTNVEEYLNSLVTGNSGTPATPVIPPLPPEEDTTPPTVSLDNPKNASTVSGTVVVSAIATDMDSGIAGVQFRLDEVDLGAEVVAAPFSMSWDTNSETPGTYRLSARARDKAGNEKESSLVSVTVDPAVQPPAPSSDNTIYVSTESRGTMTNRSHCPDNFSFTDEDILAYDVVLGCWSLYFDGSKVGLDSSEVDAFHIMPDGSILISLYAASTSLPEVGAIASTDIVRFIPTALGKDTAGRFELYFKGAAVGLDDEKEENIDAIGLLPDGRLVVSTSRNFKVPGVSGKDTDLIAFSATSLGEQTSGTWEMYFDGSEARLSDRDKVDINGIWIDSNGDIHLTTKDSFSAVGIEGDGADIIKCTPNSTVSDISCTKWDGIDNGLPAGTVVNGLHLEL